MTEWNDETPMPWGEHKGEKLEDVPAAYFLWLLEQPWISDWRDLHRYIKKNEDVIRQQVSESEDIKGDVDGFNDFDDYVKDYRGF